MKCTHQRLATQGCSILIMLRPRLCFALWLFANLILQPFDASAAELRLRFIYDGDPPVPKPIVVNKDKEFCGEFRLIDERLLVHPENRGIQNVVVYLFTGRGGTKIPAVPPRNQEVELTAENCRFNPRILVAQSGDTLVFTQNCVVIHNLNINFFSNPAMSPYGPLRAPKRYHLARPEPAPIPLECNIHPWMKGYLVLLEHPYVGVSDANGQVVIKGLPDNSELLFRVFHEAIKVPLNVSVDGTETTWERRLFSVRTTDGVTDLGPVLLKPTAFSD